ncbi:helix-turn-helix transcriptional regulator [Lactococcus sp. NH2-7C]|uniref:helix-turn-helix domain-containing protein n=1 Tax=Lactococcus sp. NH2-7C TaxID=2879149 RepID=UPI001CDB6240|nr:helix-turn-helix transcriptional regulator [Lactococcus sp. NH2-7C]MCA2390909.1 helix-turn-helix transcriptional regulator [Lactococcus sp. NH2-7C]WGV29741.1 helix-turn-helix transcriptional regulator [Lactococcus sp. NH2-7C]
MNTHLEKTSHDSLQDLEVRAVYVSDAPFMRLNFDVVIVAKLVTGQNIFESWLHIPCTGDLEKRLEDFQVLSVSTYSGKPSYQNPLSDTLLPYLHRDQLDAVASEIIKRYYPEALLTNQVLDAMKFVQNLGLDIKMRKLSKAGTIFGETIFTDTKVEIYDKISDSMVEEEIKGGTILIDPSHYLTRNYGAVNNTIVHECVHWLLHRKAFTLARLFQPKMRFLRSSFSNKTTLDWIEWQANTLTPRLQMPIVPFKDKVIELQGVYNYLNNEQSNLIGEMIYIIDSLANFYHVSKMVAKIRLLDAGFEEASGIYKYVDGHYVQPYFFKRGVLSQTQTFAISLEGAIRQSATNKELQEKLDTGSYLYVDSHFCLNDSKYLQTNKFGRLELTEYARLHIEECCLIFDLVVQDKKGESVFEDVLYRDANQEIRFEAHFINKKNVDEKYLIRNRMIELQKLAMSLPGSFSGTVSKLIEWSGLTLAKVEEQSLISERTLYRMRTDENYNVSLELILQLCIGLHLPPEISDILISRSSKRLGNMELHFLYRFLLNCCYTSTIFECNDILEAQGFSRLGKES